MRIVLLLCLLFSLISCSTKNKPIEKPPVVKIDLRKEISNIVEASPECTKYFWKDRGRAFRSYVDGMALMYAKQVCGQGSDFIKQDKINSTFYIKWQNKHYPHRDALEYYGISGSELNTYTFLIGLGMRESNGRYCKGRDRSQNYVEGHEAEAGIFQMAWVARLFNTEMPAIYEAYKSGKKSCELDAFKSPEVTRRCDSYDAKIFGNGEGRNWQVLTKKCPAFAVEWAALLIRSNYRHFGPIIRKEVEYRNACRVMLQKVEKVAKANCAGL